MGAIIRLFGSFGLSCTLLILLALLTWLGTLEQVHTGLFEVQKKYFESFFLVHDFGPIALPLPGANLVMCTLAVNLLVGGILRLRRSWDTSGVLVIHLGIVLLLGASYVKNYHSEEGHLTLYEGQSGNAYESYYRWELSIGRDLGGGRLQEYLVPEEEFITQAASGAVSLTSEALPFDVEVTHFMANCRPMPKGPMFEVEVPVIDDFFLQRERLNPTAEQNVAGAYVTARFPDGTHQAGIVWGLDTAPWTITAGGKEWTVDLRHQVYPMPFSVTLDVFTKEEHPRTNMPSLFSSDVTVSEPGASTRPVKIAMNEPLRSEGLVLYQASWGPSNARPGEPLFSTLSVVQNPADQYPLYACIVIAIGLLMHYIRKLLGYMRTEAQR